MDVGALPHPGPLPQGEGENLLIGKHECGRFPLSVGGG